MRIFIVTMLLLLAGCSSESGARYDAGYKDGYAAGYNTTCQIKSSIIEGNLDNVAYSNGYKYGYAHGVDDCRNNND